MSELYLKDNKILTFKDIEGVPAEIQRIDTPELLPYCLKNGCTMEKVNKWIKGRSIPETREGLSDVISEFGNGWMADKNCASLSDQYWIKKRTETWKKINFFSNIYSKDIGNMFFKPWEVSQKRIDNFSPDLTTNGVLRKRWIQNNDRTSCLVKMGSKTSRHDALNEVLVSVLGEQLGQIPVVRYELHVEGLMLCSKCDNFVTENLEAVPAYYVYYQEERKDNESVFSHLVKMCEKEDIPGAEDYIKWLILLDDMTGNTDRNLGNIIFLRDSNTMKFIGPAPAFDFGSGYWDTSRINNSEKSKEFGDVSDGIIKSLRKKIDFTKLLNYKTMEDIIMRYPYISAVKKSNLIDAIKKKNNRLQNEIEIGR